MKTQTASDIIGSSASPATLTAALAGNRTNKLNVERADELQLEIQYTAGATNQYAEVLVETSSDGTNWKKFPTMIATTADVQIYEGSLIIPGDKVSVTTTVENTGASLSLNHIWVRVGAREQTQSGGTPTTFGTIWINAIIKYDIN